MTALATSLLFRPTHRLSDAPHMQPSCDTQKKGQCGLRLGSATLIAQLGMQNTAIHPGPEIGRLTGVDAAPKVIAAAFKNEGFNRRSSRNKPYLVATRNKKRLSSAQEHRLWEVAMWSHVIRVDKCCVWLEGTPGRRVYITRQVGEAWLDDCLARELEKENSVMVWGGILASEEMKVLVI